MDNPSLTTDDDTWYYSDGTWYKGRIPRPRQSYDQADIGVPDFHLRHHKYQNDDAYQEDPWEKRLSALEPKSRNDQKPADNLANKKGYDQASPNLKLRAVYSHNGPINPAFHDGREPPPPKFRMSGGSQNGRESSEDIFKKALPPSEADSVESKQRHRRDRAPIGFCKFVANYPKTAFFTCIAFHIGFVVTNAILFVVGYDILPVEFERFPLQINDDITRLRDLAWQHRNNETGHIKRFTENTEFKTWNRSYSVDNVILYYELESGNIFKKGVFQEMQKLENEILNLPNYQEKYCQVDKNQTCVKPNSLLRYFDGTYKDIDPAFYDPNFDDITTIIYKAANHIQTKKDFQFFLAKDAVITERAVEAKITRSSLPVGWPIPGSETSQEKRGIIEKFLVTDIKPVIVKFVEAEPQDIQLIYYSFLMFRYDVLDQVIYDMILAVGSLLFIFCFIWFQTRSLWITGFSVISIVTGFCGANLIYRIVLDYRYFGYFHILAIYIILGIGADDIFVFYDNWRATGREEYRTLAHRLSDCYRRAAGTMFVTSLTTMVAFLASAISPILPIRSFGIFAGVLVAVNYLTVITFIPAVVIMYHNNFKGQCCCCKTRPKMNNGGKPIVRKHKGNGIRDTKNPVINFLSGPFFKFVIHKVARWFIIVIFLGILGVFIFFVTKLAPDEEEFVIFKPSHNYGKAQDRLLHSFKPSEDDRFAQVFIVWGLKPRDMSVCHSSDMDCTGNAVWDEAFDINTPPVQEALASFCQKLKYNLTAQQISDLKIRKDFVTGEVQVHCFMENFQSFLKTEQNRTFYPADMDLSIPITETKGKRFMELHSNFYNTSTLPGSFFRYFEVATSYWLNDGFKMTGTEDFYTFNDLLGEYKDEPFTRNVNLIKGAKYGTKLRYVAFSINTTLNARAIGFPKGLPVMDKWEEFVHNELSTMPATLRGGFQCTRQTWHWLKVQENLSNTAIYGIIIGVSLAFPVLVLATQNILIGFVATLTMCMITTCVIGVIPMAGWKLGILVSLNLCLVVGLAVDYVVHLAEGYHLAPHSNRLGRVHDMLHNVGISVLSGATTTLGASIFMMFAQIQFYVQFGIFIFSVIGFSLIFALVFFSTVLAIIGPEGHTGSIVPLFRWLQDLVAGRDRENHVDCHHCEGKGFYHKDLLAEKKAIANGHADFYRY